MRPITFHAINPCNEALKLVALDGPGPGGASHKYAIEIPAEEGKAGFRNPENGAWINCCVLNFQNGPVKENGEGVNGITHETLLAILIDRMEGFQSGPWACPENALTIGYLRAALAQLHARTNAREARGVEGTHKI